LQHFQNRALVNTTSVFLLKITSKLLKAIVYGSHNNECRLGIKDFAVLFSGEKVENPKYLKTFIQTLKVLQKRVSRKVKGSNRRRKAIIYTP